MQFSWKTVRYILEAIILLELLAALGYFYPVIGTALFIISCLVILWLTIRRLEWGLYVLVIDLLISSKGYLLSLNLGGFKLSWRMAIWLIIMAVWFVQLIVAIYRRQAWPKQLWQRLKDSGWLILLAMIIFAIINAWWRGHGQQNQPTAIFKTLVD
ncbi:MAG TPA: hypothetical protein PLX67_02480, partial [bacterium]|nr:hypothetical protein [bacterium]